VETDEDIELIFPDRHLYIQVKTRTLPLQTADISKTLVHFDQLRKTHLDGKRPLVPSFYIVSNIKPNHELAEKMKSVDWGNDIFLLWPNCPVGSPVTIPPCWSDLSEALTWCIEKAGSGSI